MNTMNMTTLPPNYLRLSPAWLETNPLPEDGLLLEADDTWKPSSQRGRITATPGFDYATARTDLPKEAYLNKTEPAPDLTQPGLPKADLTQPGAEAASERAEAGVEIRIKPMLCKHCGEPMEEYVHKCKVLGLQQQLDDERNPNCDGSLAFHLAESNQREKEAREKFQQAAKWNKLTELEITNLRSLNGGLNEDLSTLRAQLDAKEAELQQAREGRAAQESELTKALAAYEDQVQSLEAERDKLRAEVEEWKIVAKQTAKDLNAKLNATSVELDAVRKALFPDGLNYEPDMALSIRTRTELTAKCVADLKASQARCGELERALTKAERFVWDFAHKNPTHFMKGVEQDPWGAHELFTQINALLTPSQQPDKEPAPPIAPEGKATEGEG